MHIIILNFSHSICLSYTPPKIKLSDILHHSDKANPKIWPNRNTNYTLFFQGAFFRKKSEFKITWFFFTEFWQKETSSSSLQFFLQKKNIYIWDKKGTQILDLEGYNKNKFQIYTDTINLYIQGAEPKLNPPGPIVVSRLVYILKNNLTTNPTPLGQWFWCSWHSDLKNHSNLEKFAFTFRWIYNFR